MRRGAEVARRLSVHKQCVIHWLGRIDNVRPGKRHLLDDVPPDVKISKTTPCKVAWWSSASMPERSRKNILTRRANQGHYSIVAQFVKRPGPARQWPLRRDCRQKSLPTIEVAPARRKRRDASRVAARRCAYARGDIDVNTAPDPNEATALAATGQPNTVAPNTAVPRTAAAPRIKLLSHGFYIEHQDPELGEQLMAEALGVADRDAMRGMLGQLVKASVKGERPDEVTLAFMISMVKSLKPRDAIEGMLVAQMVSVHVMAMRSAHHLANAEDLAQQDSAEIGRA